MPEMPRDPSLPNDPETRLSHPQEPARDSTGNFGPDHYAEPVTDASAHHAEMAAAHEGRPTIREQRARQGMT